MADRCKACDAPIVWVTMLTTGRANPLDAKPAEDGNVAVHEGSGRVIPKTQRTEYRLAGVPLFKSHFASCPAARSFRRG